MEPEFSAIGLDEKFQFACDPQVSCFNECCHDLHQVLTPYDVLRLKDFFKLESGLFLERYTLQAVGPETGLPVVSLQPDGKRNLACPFVSPEGCTVYPDRPSSCRIYPLARAVTRCRETGRKKEHYALLKEAHCCGFYRGSTQSVRQWVSDQALEPYHAMNDMLLDLISLKNRYRPGVLDLVTRQSFFMALYDLDRFRHYLKEEGDSHNHLLISLGTFDAIIDDDIELLKFGFRWMGKILST